MKKTIITVGAITLLICSGLLYYFLTIKPDSTNQTTTSELTAAQLQGQPTRAAEIKGIVQSIEGNEIIVANELNTEELTEEEKAAKKAERQAMSQEERQALKAEETAQSEKENVTITIPVGVNLVKSTGDVTRDLVAAEIADIRTGVYVSIWVKDYRSDNADVEFVKVRPAAE